MSDMYDVETRIPHGQIHVRRANGTLDVATVNEELSKTDQQWALECDINFIMKKFLNTGQVNHLNHKTGVYADFTEIKDLQYAHEVVKYADEAFMTLPAEVRKKFENNPTKLLEFLQDPKNYDEGVELGFFERKQKMQNEQKANDDLNDEGKMLKNAKNKIATKPKQKQDSVDEVDE